MTSSLKFEITVYFLAFFASSFRVTEEDWLSERAVWPTLFLLNVSTALKGIHKYILFVVTAAGVVHVASLKRGPVHRP